MRALLDEVERVAPPASEDDVSEQLVEELARLGCRFIEIANALTATVDAQEEGRRSPTPISPRTDGARGPRIASLKPWRSAR